MHRATKECELLESERSYSQELNHIRLHNAAHRSLPMDCDAAVGATNFAVDLPLLCSASGSA